MSRKDPADALEQCVGRQMGKADHRGGEPGIGKALLQLRAVQQSGRRGRKGDLVAGRGKVKGALAGRIAHQRQPPPLILPDRKRKISGHMVEALLPPSKPAR